MSIRGSKTANDIRDAIIQEWNKHEWGWDTHTGQATLRLLPIISAIMARELSEFKIMMEALTDTINISEMESVRAKDAVLLYNSLKRSGMQEEDLGKTVRSFLDGEKMFEQTYTPNRPEEIQKEVEV